MDDLPSPPGLVRRVLPWVAAIVVGVGLGLGWTWWMGGGAGSAVPATTAAAPGALAGDARGAAQPASGTGPPMALTLSNRDCTWGADFDAYYQQAADLKAQIERRDGRAVDRIVVRVPNRPWRGVAVGGVAAIEGGAAIIFAAPLADVRAALAAAGITVAADGAIPLTGALNDTVVQRLEPVPEGSSRYGATMLSCGS